MKYQITHGLKGENTSVVEASTFREFGHDFIAFNNGSHDVLVVPKSLLMCIELVEEVNDGEHENSET